VTGAALAAQAPVTGLSFTTARPILESIRDALRPPEFRGRSIATIEAAWPAWVDRRNREIRARVEQGDEDSIINLLLFGTTFTAAPRLTEQDLATAFAGRRPIIEQRVTDFVRRAASPQGNERLEFVRAFADRRGMSPATPAGAGAFRKYLDAGVARVAADRRLLAERAAGAIERVLTDPTTGLPEASTLYADRGLASDTSLFIDFAVDAALAAMNANGVLTSGSVRRAAIVGPGLDFADKREGYDFYPLQTMQPFAVVDALLRQGLAPAQGAAIATFDVSARINQHLETGRTRAAAGEGYVLQLARDTAVEWNPNLIRYWSEFGSSIGEAVPAVPVPSGMPVAMRAVRVRTAVVRGLEPHDLNIVLQRAGGPPFDLVVATNILVYYDVFEQSLALANIASMLRPGGMLLTNTPLFQLPSIPLTQIGFTDVLYTREASARDRIFWYRRD
jgi:hypothetical protein